MKVQFEWQAGDEDGEWETIARIEGRTRLKIPRWAWAVLLASIVVIAGGGYAGLRRWHDAALRRVAFQIQSVIDLEARALARHDFDLFLAQQDSSVPAWVSWQASRAREERFLAVRAAADGCTRKLQPGPQRQGPLEPPAQVEKVELRGDVAWVEVVVGQEPVRRVLFYRQTDTGWVHTNPDDQFWQDGVTLLYDNVRVRGHERDLPHAKPLVKQIKALFDDVCETLDCPAGSTLEVDLAVGMRTDELSAFAQDRLTLASPWLAGIPVDGSWSQEYLEKLRYWVAYAATSQVLSRAAEGELDPLQKAITAEYAAWYARQDPAQSPLLRRVIDQHGTDALSELMHDLQQPGSLSWFVEKWLSLSPSTAGDILFESLLNLEREAILVGQKDTFLLLQESDSRWIELQETHYDDIQSGQVGFRCAPAQVKSIEIEGNHAFVTLREQTSLELEGRADRIVSRVEIFSLRDGGWKRGW